MNAILTYTLFGYLCGSILFARVAAALFHQDREYEKSSVIGSGIPFGLYGYSIACKYVDCMKTT